MTSSSNVLETGVRLSTPIYVTVSAPEAKLFLNALRAYVNADPTPVATRGGGISVLTAQKGLRQVRAEQALGMSLDVLRQQLLSNRSSLTLEQALLIQQLTGQELFNRKDVEKTYKGYIDSVCESVKAKAEIIDADG